MANAFVTDLNDRERERYGSCLDKLAELCQATAAALREGNDLRAGGLLALIALLGPATVDQLIPIFHRAASVLVPDSPEGL